MFILPILERLIINIKADTYNKSKRIGRIDVPYID